jgi:hypothetical protein
MANKQDKIVTSTAKKVIIRIDEINKVLSEDEVKMFLGLVDKLKNGVD